MPYCSNCGAEVRGDERFCPSCGHFVSAGQTGPGGAPGYPRQMHHPSTERKSPGIAAMLALVLGIFGLWGIGHIYVGQVGNGIMLLFLGIIVIILSLLFFFPIILGLIGWIWQTYDAHRLAKEFNRSVEITGRAPW